MKYNIVVCCYDKVLLNVAAYVIPGWVCVCVCVSVCVVVWSKQEHTLQYCILLFQ
jgi:hypothetical protein